MFDFTIMHSLRAVAILNEIEKIRN